MLGEGPLPPNYTVTVDVGGSLRTDQLSRQGRVGKLQPQTVQTDRRLVNGQPCQYSGLTERH